jgi:APA family basic amino acid/polyamine antiporter
VNGAQLTGAVAIVALTAVNHLGVKAGAGVQNLFTVGKLVAVGALVALGFGIASPVEAHWGAPPPMPWHRMLVPFGAALIAVLWTYDGWYALTFAAGEVRNPARALPRGLLLGIGAVLAVYLGLNLVYLRALPIETLASTSRAAEASAAALAGPGAARWVVVAVAISAFGCLAATVLYASRIYQPMAADGVFLRSVAAIDPRWRTPVPALWLQAAWSVALALTGGYTALFTYTTFGGVLFHVATGLALFRLRRTAADAERPYRAWGYPFVPGLFVLGMVLLTGSTLVAAPRESLLGLLVIGAGIPAYAWWRRRA